MRSKSSHWVLFEGKVYQSIPQNRIVDPSPAELEQLLKDHPAVALRYSAPVTASTGQISYHVVWTGKRMEIEGLPKKVRYDVRKGLANVHIERVSFSRLAIDGWRAREETLIRQGRAGAETRTWWDRLCRSAEGLPGFEAWGALSDDAMIASLIAFSTPQCSSILYQQSLSSWLDRGVNNALAFAFSQDVLNRRGVDSIFYGLHSLDAPQSVDNFKFRMGFTPKPVRQCVVFHPRYAPFANRASHGVLELLHRLAPASWYLAKGEGIFRYYVQGKLPVERQTWPACLEDRREEIMAELQRAPA